MSKKPNPEKAALRRAAELVGGQSALALILGYQDRRPVWQWLTDERRIPAEKCPLIEQATDGLVRCEELRPDVAWDVLRKQAA